MISSSSSINPESFSQFGEGSCIWWYASHGFTHYNGRLELWYLCRGIDKGASLDEKLFVNAKTYSCWRVPSVRIVLARALYLCNIYELTWASSLFEDHFKDKNYCNYHPAARQNTFISYSVEQICLSALWIDQIITTNNHTWKIAINARTNCIILFIQAKKRCTFLSSKIISW